MNAAPAIDNVRSAGNRGPLDAGGVLATGAGLAARAVMAPVLTTTTASAMPSNRALFAAFRPPFPAKGGDDRNGPVPVSLGSLPWATLSPVNLACFYQNLPPQPQACHLIIPRRETIATFEKSSPSSDSFCV
jgi:hypothetical protein